MVGHAGREVVQHVVDGDAQAADTGLSTPLAWFHGDDVSVVHDEALAGVNPGALFLSGRRR